MTVELLRAQSLTKRFLRNERQLTVLDGVDFRVQKGEQIAVTGASGAGKSTLLHLLGALDDPDSGEVFFMGESLQRLSSRGLAAYRNESLGFVFQFHHLLPDFDALENVMMPALIRRENPVKARARARRVLEEVGLEARMEHRPQELSGGEQQRVALARALVLEPQLLLADEVTGNLDAKTASGIHRLLGDLCAMHKTTQVIVTHNESWAQALPRRVTLKDGTLIEESR